MTRPDDLSHLDPDLKALAEAIRAEGLARARAVEVDALVDLDWSELWERDWSEAEWLFDDVLARGRGHAMWARHGVGKSLFSLWLSVEVVKAGHVVIYVDLEMGLDDLQERLSDMGHGPATDLSRLHYVSLPALLPLDTAPGGAQLAAKVDAVQAEHPDMHVAVVIDTISRALQGEENSNDTAQDFYRHTGAELKRRGVTWLRLDHAGWEGNHARGASAKADDVDIVWELLRTDDGVDLKNHKRRMGWVPDRVAFNMAEAPDLGYQRIAGS